MADNSARKRIVDLHLLEGEVTRALTDFRNAPEGEIVQAAGRLSAESIRREYELAAAAIEGMGQEVMECAAKLEGSLHESDHDMKLIAEAAAAIRDKSKAVYLQIEAASALSKDIRDTIAKVREKVGA